LIGAARAASKLPPPAGRPPGAGLARFSETLPATGRVSWTGGRGIAKSTANEGSPGIERRRGPRCGENERIPGERQ